MTTKEKIMLDIRDIADELRSTTSWARIERLADWLDDINDELEEL